MLAEFNGKAAAYVSGVLSVKRKAFVLETSPAVPAYSSTQPGADHKFMKTASKRKPNTFNPSISPATAASNTHRIEYREKSAILLGQVDEDKLEKQVKTVQKVTLFINLDVHWTFCSHTPFFDASTTQTHKCISLKDRETPMCS
jgi:hypothetical protein